MADSAYTPKNKISIHLISKDMLHEIAIGMITKTSSILRHNRDNICEEIRGLYGITRHTPLGVHEYRQKQRYGSPGNNYQVESTCLALYTDKDNISEERSSATQTYKKNHATASSYQSTAPSSHVTRRTKSQPKYTNA
jgi:hypothetical protein